MKTSSASAVIALSLSIGTASAQPLPSGFHLDNRLSNRSEPSGVYFAHDGRVFVTEKGGKIFVYQNLLDTAPQVFADLSTNVHNFWDRGLLGFALHPRFPEVPYVYVQYAYNGGLFPDQDPVPWAPRWPSTDCPDPPGATNNGGGCVISGRVSRLTVDGGSAGDELVLVEDWFQQFPSHSIGTIAFGPDGYLYAGGGDGASFGGTDFGQWGNPDWPDQRAPANQGGALRPQGLEIESQYNDAGHDVWLNGSIIRIDPITGVGAPGNPLASDPQPNAKRILAYGLRNPFRFTFRPGAGDVWVGDVGYNTWEEINRIPAPPTAGSAALTNFGWPCFEGRGHTGGYSGANLAICNNLYANGDTGNADARTPATPPWYTYVHQGGSDATGILFYEGTSYPPPYHQSLFLADNSRAVLFNVPFVDANSDGIPDAPADSSAAAFFGGPAATAVQLASGAGGDVFFANLLSGRISRLYYCDGCTNQAPSAAIALNAGSIADGAPRTIGFAAANSVDPNSGDTLSYDWDLDGDGSFGDASGATASRAYATAGSYRVAVRVSDQLGASDVQSMLVTVTGSLPVADVGVTLDDGVESARPGDALTYTLIVTNHGTDAVEGVAVVTEFSTQLTGVSWTCAPAGAATCAPSGSGDIADSVDLPVDDSVTYTIVATVSATADAPIESRATLTLPPDATDPDPSNNSASDIDALDDTIFKDGFETPAP